jgi:hypothetical protein
MHASELACSVFCVAHLLAHWWGSGELDRGDPFGKRHLIIVYETRRVSSACAGRPGRHAGPEASPRGFTQQRESSRVLNCEGVADQFLC